MKNYITTSALILAAALLLTASFYGGETYRSHEIQVTCEDDLLDTVINGVTYECLTPKLADEYRNDMLLLRKLLEQRGHGGESA